MLETIHHVFEWLEAMPISAMIRESSWASATLAAIHIMALTMSVGFLVWFDLRLLGVSLRGVPVSTVYRRLMPWAAVGFVTMLATGGLMLAAFATLAYRNPYFWVKFAALGLAGVNAGAYHVFTERRIAEWDRDVKTPRLARMAGLISLTLWAIVIVAGRVMSYTLLSK